MELWGDGGLFGAWSDYLGRWEVATAPLLDRPPPLQPDDFDSPTWYHLTLRIQEAVNARLSRWQDLLIRHLSAATDEFGWGRALVDARHGLRPLLAFTQLPELTDELRTSLIKAVEGAVRGAQQQLEDDAQNAIRRGISPASAEMQLRQLRGNRLTAVLLETHTDATVSDPFRPLPDSPSGERRRRILIN